MWPNQALEPVDKESSKELKNKLEIFLTSWNVRKLDWVEN